MTVTPADITWARGQCTNIREWVLRGQPTAPNELMPGHYVMTAPPQMSSSGGEGRAATWIAWFSALRGYYKCMMRFCAGDSPTVIQGAIGSCPFPNQRIGMQQAQHVFWSIVLRGRGRKIHRGRWIFSEIQLEILGNEEVNREFYSQVRSSLEQYVQAEQARYASEHDNVQMGPREQLGPVITRHSALRRNREYGVRLEP